MPPVASSSRRHPKDPSPKAEVDTSERTVCFRKPSSSNLGVRDDCACEIKTRKHVVFIESRSSSEESAKSTGSSSVNNNMEYRRLKSGNDSPEEYPPSPPLPHIVNIPILDIPETTQQKVNQDNSEEPQMKDYMDTYVDWSLRIIYSWGLFPLYAILIGFTAQAAYMGATYGDECPYLRDGPSILFLMGCSGFSSAIFQLLAILQKNCCPEGGPCLSATQITSFIFWLFYLATFGIELNRFVSAEGLPSNIRGPNYCDVYFYGYVCWSNYSFSLLTVVLFIVLAPPFFIHYFCHGKS